MSDVPAQWDAVKRAVTIRGKLGSRTLIVGNGDVRDIADARAKTKETGCDGVMLGRAIYGNPWLFSNSQELKNRRPQEKIQALLEHLSLFDELLSDTTNFAIMKKHFKAYIEGFPGAKDLRVKLMEARSESEVRGVLTSFSVI